MSLGRCDAWRGRRDVSLARRDAWLKGRSARGRRRGSIGNSRNWRIRLGWRWGICRRSRVSRCRCGGWGNGFAGDGEISVPGAPAAVIPCPGRCHPHVFMSDPKRAVRRIDYRRRVIPPAFRTRAELIVKPYAGLCYRGSLHRIQRIADLSRGVSHFREAASRALGIGQGRAVARVDGDRGHESVLARSTVDGSMLS